MNHPALHPQRSAAVLINLATLILVVVALYFGKPVLMPLALATLLTFLLNPMVSALCRRGLGLALSVTLVVILVFSVLGGMVWAFGSQLTSLVADLPDYKQNIREKWVDLRRAGSGSPIERIRATWSELRGEIQLIEGEEKRQAAATNTAAPPTNAAPAEPEPVPVVVRGEAEEGSWTIPTALGPLAEVAATAALAVVLVIFMLLRGRELRNRLIIVFGQSRIPTTTRALDEAAERISRYLLMQTIVNSTYGLAVGIALYFIGLPYALMWGFLATLLRFIPYVGPWLGAAMPILLSLAVFPGWLHPLLILGLILVFELFSNMLMEPMLYGPTVGVSEVALIVAVAFWTWIWGPIGLALAAPLTVCLVVVGKYVPSLAFVPLLLGDEPVMSPAVQFYQRLLAMDDTEASEIARQFGASHKLIELYDELLLPALLSAKHDVKNQELSEEDLDFVIDTTEKIIAKTAPGPASAPLADAVPILAVPVEDAIDELILRMLAQILPETVRLHILSSGTLSGELMEAIDEHSPALLCIGAGIPGGAERMRHLAKRVKSRHPALPVILGRWGLVHSKRRKDLADLTGIRDIASSLKDARNYLTQFAQLTPAEPSAPRLLEPVVRN